MLLFPSSWPSSPAAGGSNTVISDVVDALRTRKPRPENTNETDPDEDVAQDASPEYSADVLLSHVYPADCANLTSAMKTIISGFVDQTAGEVDAGGTLACKPPLNG